MLPIRNVTFTKYYPYECYLYKILSLRMLPIQNVTYTKCYLYQILSIRNVTYTKYYLYECYLYEMLSIQSVIFTNVTYTECYPDKVNYTKCTIRKCTIRNVTEVINRLNASAVHKECNEGCKRNCRFNGQFYICLK